MDLINFEKYIMNLFNPQKLVKMSLVGLNGNAFFLMGQFKTNAQRQGWAKEDIDKVLEECKKSDYDHLLQVLMAHTDDCD